MKKRDDFFLSLLSIVSHTLHSPTRQQDWNRDSKLFKPIYSEGMRPLRDNERTWYFCMQVSWLRGNKTKRERRKKWSVVASKLQDYVVRIRRVNSFLFCFLIHDAKNKMNLGKKNEGNDGKKGTGEPRDREIIWNTWNREKEGKGKHRDSEKDMKSMKS